MSPHSYRLSHPFQWLSRDVTFWVLVLPSTVGREVPCQGQSSRQLVKCLSITFMVLSSAVRPQLHFCGFSSSVGKEGSLTHCMHLRGLVHVLFGSTHTMVLSRVLICSCLPLEWRCLNYGCLAPIWLSGSIWEGDCHSCPAHTPSLWPWTPQKCAGTLCPEPRPPWSSCLLPCGGGA